MDEPHQEITSNNIDSAREIDDKERERGEDIAEADEHDFSEEIALHESVGLEYVGLNADGEPEYIGSEEQWDDYERLVNK